MTENEKMRQALRGFFADGGPAVLRGKVTAIDQAESDGTISVDIAGDGSLILDDVRLRSTVDGALGMYVVPEVSSQVLLLRIDKSDEFLAVGFSTWEKVLIKGESISLEVGKDAVIFNDSALGSFMTDINQLVSKINSLESCINDLKQVFSTWVPMPQDGGASLKTAAATWAAQTLIETTVDDLKDSTIQH